VNEKILGYEYTEENTPYSSMFRTQLPVGFTSIDKANVGTYKHILLYTYIVIHMYINIHVPL
jgi:hypothetical protein